MIQNKSHIVVIGNEKGGTGKSTISMHLAISLMRNGLKTATIDLDGKQGTLTRYIENRIMFTEKKGIKLPIPEHIAVTSGNFTDSETCAIDAKKFEAEITTLSQTNDVIIIDTPGTDNHLFRTGHNFADTLITPINDSLIDIDILARVDSETLKLVKPSHYAEKIWECRKNRALKGNSPLNWFIIRNRLSHLDSRNKRQMEELLAEMSKRFGFVSLPGMGERVIYREMFLKGLTILDIREKGIDLDLSLSHVAAKQEIKTIVSAVTSCVMNDKKKFVA